MGVAAGVLLLISLGGWLYHRTQLADIAADHLRLQVTGPARLRPGMPNAYSVMTTSVTGEPVSAQVDFVFRASDDKRLISHEKTDESGRLTVTVPAELDVSAGLELEVTARHDGRREKVATQLAVEPVRHVTYLALDKPLYWPGETIHYRSLTLSRFHLLADREMPVRFEILDPGGAPVAGSQQEGVTRGGVAGGRFQIPEELAGGQYTLVARSLDGAFPDERRTFFIRRYHLPRLNQKLEFARNGYAPGETVVADFSCQRAEGGPAAGARLRIVAVVDGQVLYEETAEATGHGTFHVEFLLPEDMERGDGQLVVVADDGGIRETVAKRIPLILGPIDVRFYPEGGDLVADLENRVYFAARDPLGKPVDVRGRVVDGEGRQVAEVATTHLGMGQFSMVPLPREEYRLALEHPADVQSVVRLPEVSANGKVVLSTGLGVFQEGKPLEFTVRASQAGLPLVASAWCRGMPVGQQAFVTGEREKANSVAIPLDAEAGGVIRLTIYDYSASPPEPVAERLVYRRPARRLQVDVDDHSQGRSPGDEVGVSLSVSDEEGNPVSATLGVSVAADALWSLAADHTAAMPIHFLLGTEVGSAEELGDPDLYRPESREAAVALDLLLGTQGWRRFLEKKLPGPGEGGREGRRLARLAALGGRANPPAMFDNLLELQEQYRENLATYQANRTKTSNTLTTLSFFGGVGLVMLVAMLNLLNVASGARLWATAIAAATVCLIIGGILMDPGRWKSPPEGAVPYVPFDMAPAPPSEDQLADSPDLRAARMGLPPSDTADERPPRPEESSQGADEAVPTVVRCDPQGRARVRFHASGPIGSFRVLVDAHADDGRIGYGTGRFVVPASFQIEPRLPLEVSPGDRIDVPLTILNNTGDTLPVEVVLEHDDLVELDGDARRSLELKPRGRACQFFPLRAMVPSGDGQLTFRAAAGELADEVTCSLSVVPDGSPRTSPDGGQVKDDACPVRLSTRLDHREVPWGQIVALAAELANATDDRQPTTVACLGLPAGLEVCPGQLERLKRSGKIDFYQTRAREVLCYWRALAPNETVELKLDLIAAVPGTFTGPPSHAYLHAAAEHKIWNEPLVIEIKKD